MVRNFKIHNKEIKNGLYLVPTPIGNLADVTLRALQVLNKSDYILCEDTRVSKILFEKYQIKSKLISNHKFNEKKNVSKILELLRTGSTISLVCDAGTPTVSDPGSTLINECIKNNLDITPLPGASSVTTAISASGFSGNFFFYGFFPEKNKLILNDLENLSNLNSSIIFFISSKKFQKSIPIIQKFFNDRKILVCKEMTKYFEEFIRLDINELDQKNFLLKGELTIVISEKKIDKNISHSLSESDKRIIGKMINKLSIKEIINLIQNYRKISKKEIYNYCVKIKNEN